MVLLEKRIIEEEKEVFGLFKDQLGHKERDFTFLNSDQALNRFKNALLEHIQLNPEEAKDKRPRLLTVSVLNTLYFSHFKSYNRTQ